MGRHGENIHKRKCDGRWEGRCLYYDAAKKKKRYHYVYGHTYDEAREKKEVFLKIVKNTGQTVPGESSVTLKNILFADAAEEWLACVRVSNKPSTYAKYSGIYHNYIEDFVQGAFLTDITDMYVKEKITDNLLSDNLKRSIYSVLNNARDFASERCFIELQKLKKPASSEHARPVEILSVEEQSALYVILYNKMDIHKMGVSLCLQTGMRLGEICALKWSDIDFGRRIIRVSRTVQRLPMEGQKKKTALVVTEPKSPYSRREIPVSQKVIEMILQFRQDCGGEYIFCGNRPMEPRTLQYSFKKFLGMAGVAQRNFHVLRHTFATNCIERNMDAKCLSEILGHSSVNITLNRYVHSTMDAKRRHMEALDDFVSQIRGQA